MLAQLKEKQDALNEVEKQIATLKKSFKDSVDAKQKLESTMAQTEARLLRASKLQTALADEQVRWSDEVTL